MRVILLFAVLFTSQLSLALSKSVFVAQTTTGASSAIRPENLAQTNQVFQASGTTASGTGSATIKLQGSNDGTNWVDIGSISLTLGTAATSDKVVSVQNWLFVRGNVTALTGTGASINATLNY